MAEKKSTKKAETKEVETKKAVKEEETIVVEEPAEEPVKQRTNPKTYIISKRKEDGKWALKYSGGERVIKLFDTKKEALEFTKKRAENNDRGVLVRASKGAHKGKFQK